MIPLSQQEQDRIIKNVVGVIKSGDSNKLSRAGYNFLYLASGFIAHYNIDGFRHYYQNTEDLKRDIVANRWANQWDNFKPDEADYAYYMAKRDTYNRILEAI